MIDCACKKKIQIKSNIHVQAKYDIMISFLYFDIAVTVNCLSYENKIINFSY